MQEQVKGVGVGSRLWQAISMQTINHSVNGAATLTVEGPGNGMTLAGELRATSVALAAAGAITQPGTQRNGHALEDTIVMNVFATATDDPAQVVAEIARPPFHALTEDKKAAIE